MKKNGYTVTNQILWEVPRLHKKLQRLQIGSTNELKVISERLQKRRAMQIIEFYYACLFINNSYDLYWYVKKNEWYFKRLRLEAQEQIRNYYKKLREEENE